MNMMERMLQELRTGPSVPRKAEELGQALGISEKAARGAIDHLRFAGHNIRYKLREGFWLSSAPPPPMSVKHRWRD
jgi:biotin operon repressor